MNKEFIPYEQASELIELGFTFYDSDLEMKCYAQAWDFSLSYKKNLPLPLYRQAFRWFRKKYNMQSSIKFIRAKYSFEIHFERIANGENPPIMVWHLVDSWLGLNLDLFDTYEDAELACLNKLIEIVKGGNND